MLPLAQTVETLLVGKTLELGIAGVVIVALAVALLWAVRHVVAQQTALIAAAAKLAEAERVYGERLAKQERECAERMQVAQDKRYADADRVQARIYEINTKCTETLTVVAAAVEAQAVGAEKVQVAMHQLNERVQLALRDLGDRIERPRRSPA